MKRVQAVSFLFVLAGTLAMTNGTYGQAINTISGYVFGYEHRPLPDMNVELLNDVGSFEGRARTDSTGAFRFRVSAGVFVVRVYTFGTEYEEQERRVEIQNFSYSTSNGQTITTGGQDENIDFYLRLRKGVSPASIAIFVQDVPPDAKKAYDKAIAELDDKHTAEGLAGLRHAIELFPKYYYALERLGTEYIRMQKREGYEAAMIILSSAVEVNPRGYKSWHGLAYARRAIGDYAGAMTAVEKAIELNASSSEDLLLRGILYRQAKKFAEAEKDLLHAKELSDDRLPTIHLELGLVYGNGMKRYADAVRELKAFLKAQPQSKDADNIRKLITEFEAKAAPK